MLVRLVDDAVARRAPAGRGPSPTPRSRAGERRRRPAAMPSSDSVASPTDDLDRDREGLAEACPSSPAGSSPSRFSAARRRPRPPPAPRCRRRGPRAPGSASQATSARDPVGGRGSAVVAMARASTQRATNTFVSCAPAARGAVRREREQLAVGREHREAVEAGRVGDALEVGAVDVDRPQMSNSRPARVAVVRREDDALAVGMKNGANEAAPR